MLGDEAAKVEEFAADGRQCRIAQLESQVVTASGVPPSTALFFML